MTSDLRHIETSDGSQLAECTVSLNGRFTLAWRDSDGKGRGGARDSGKGLYWLFDSGVEVCKGKMERPKRGHVADDGTFSLEDWLFTQSLASVFYAFRSDGHVLVRKRLRANLFNSCLSETGEYAVCLTASNPNSSDGHKLFLFSLPSGVLLWRQSPPFSPAFYEFNQAARTLVIRPGPGQDYHHFISCTLSIPRAANGA
jgi:hypothetical protein